MREQTYPRLIVVILLGTLAGCDGNDAQVEVDGRPYLAQRRDFETKLVRKGPSPQEWKAEPLPHGVREVTYHSDGMELKAWLAVPIEPGRDRKWPALVYFHGGFAFGASDMSDCKPFLDAGYVVLCPMLRGENGNPGNFELFYGEVDDARAAIKSLAGQENIDPDRIYAFGHSAGGAITALLSLYDNVPIRHSGSCGSLYDSTTFDGWKDMVPFDMDNRKERTLRLLLGNIRFMQKPHYCFLGTLDPVSSNQFVARDEMISNSKLEVKSVPGDHFSSLRFAMQEYLRVCEWDK